MRVGAAATVEEAVYLKDVGVDAIVAAGCSLNFLRIGLIIINTPDDLGERFVNAAWAKVLNKQVRYRFVIDAATI